ncbi:MAG: nicotinamide-nucleotide adenylyltransferase [Promethearchaeota archaeon]
MMKKEIIACVKEEHIKYLQAGQISKYVFPMERSIAHQKRIPHLITRFFILSINPKKEVLYLVQKRSKKKEDLPEYFTDSASGHVLYKPNLNLKEIENDAKRELHEEFGILPKDLVKTIFYDLREEGDSGVKEIAYIFIGLVNRNVKLNPNPEELNVKESRFYTRSELLSLLKKDNFVIYSKNIWNTILKTDLNNLFDLKVSQKRSSSNYSKIALFIGRFQPFHYGHWYVLKNILKYHKKIKIGIGSAQISNTREDPFTSEERRQFIETMMKSRNISPFRYEIFEIPDIFNASKWVDHVISIVGDFDILYSNSDWVRQLFKQKGILIGKKIEIFKKRYNGSKIRKLIAKNDKNWHLLVPKEIRNLIIKFNGLERIKKLYLEEKYNE